MLIMRVGKLLKVRPDETRSVTLLVVLMFIPAVGAAVGSPSIQALFFARFGAEFLPYMYVALGTVTVVATLGVTALLGRVSRVRLYLTLPVLLALLLVGSRVLVAFDLNWFYPVLWLGMSLFVTLQGLVTWGLAGLLCDTRQAKRLFPLFGAGFILGTALGGLLTRFLVGWLGTENLLLVWAAALLMVVGVVRVLTRDVTETRPRSGRRPSSVTHDLQVGFQFVRRSTLWRWYSMAGVLFSVLFFSLAFPFSKAATAQFPAEDTLAGFLGLFQGLTTSAALVLSLFLANRFYARFGFMAVILAYAVIYFAGFGVLVAYATFAALVVFRFLQVSWSQGVVNTAYQATFSVVPPERRDQTRAFFDGVTLQVGIVLVGLLLIVGEQFLKPQHLYLIGAGSAVLATFAMWRTQRAYAGELVSALRAGRPHVFFSEEQPFGGFQRDAAAVAVAVAGLSDPEPAVRRVSAEILGNLKLPEATQALVSALDDPEPSVRAAMLRALAQAHASPALLDVAACLNDREPEVRVQAIAAVRDLAGFPRGAVAHVQPLLEDAEPAVRSTAAVTLLSLGPHAEAVGVLQTMAATDDVLSRVEALQAFAAWGDKAGFGPAVDGLGDPHPAVRRAAASAVARIDAQRCVYPLVRALGDEDSSVRLAVAEALGAVGAEAIEPTLEALSDPDLEVGALLALGELPVHEMAGRVREYARRRVASALHYHELRLGVRSAGTADGRVDLLADSLQASARTHGTNALRAVGLLGDGDAISLAIENLDGADSSQQANALEMLDSIQEREIIRPLLSLWEADGSTPGRPGDGDAERKSLQDWLLQVMQDPDPWLRACAALAAVDAATGSGVISQLRDQLGLLARSDREPVVREAALAALNGGSFVETLPTLSLMERILFLRRVPLFAELPPVELKQVAGIAEEYLFSDGEIISHQDDLGDEMYIIVSGEVVVMAGASGNESVELARRQPDDYVGEMSIISHEPRMASLVAEGDVRVLCIGQKQFEGILRERPETSLAVMRVLCARLREWEAAGQSAHQTLDK